MITKNMFEGDGPILFEKAIIPLSRKTTGVYEVYKIEDNTPINVSLNWKSLATPQGYGCYIRGRYIFRRVDKIWISILDYNLAKAIDRAVKQFSNGDPITFQELALDNEEKILKCAYALGILGERKFYTMPENFDYCFYNGWLERVKGFNAYYNGLVLMERYNSKTFIPLLTFWGDSRVVCRKKKKIEDSLVKEFIDVFSGKKVVEINKEHGIETAKILALLVGAGVLDLEKETK